MIAPQVITQDFPCSGQPVWAKANKGIVATDISSGVKWRQATIPSGNNWVELSKNNIYNPPSGTGDVVGPASAVDSNFAAFDGVTGKLIKDSGFNSASFQPALGYTPVQSVTDDGLGGVSVDNTDPQNPILSFSGVADGVTITGTGVTADPFVAAVPDSLSPLLLMGG